MPHYGTWSLLEIIWTAVTLLTTLFVALAQWEQHKNAQAVRDAELNGAIHLTALIMTVILWSFLAEQFAFASIGVYAGLTPEPILPRVSNLSAYSSFVMIAFAVLKCAAAAIVVYLYRRVLDHEIGKGSA